MKVEFDQMIAGIVIVGGIVLRCFGVDSEIWGVVLIAAGFLFGTGWQARKQLKKTNSAPDKTEQ